MLCSQDFEVRSNMVIALDRASLQPPGSASDRDANDRSLALFAPNSANVVVEAVLDDPDAETGIEVYLEEIEDIIGFLIQLLAVLRDPLHEADRATSQHDDTYSAEAFRRLAGILFPNTEVDTRRKLGEQNQKRWRNLGHTMMGTRLLGAQSGSERTYQRKFAPWDVPFRPINAVFIKESNPDGLSMIHSEIDASTVCTHADTILERTVVPDDSVTSGTDPQPTILKRLILPPPPTELPCNTPQRCGYCHFEIPLAFSSIPFDEAQWSTHIFADLAAYSCTHEGCVRGNRPFSDKREWIQHELDHHRTGTVWYCGACRIDFDVPNSLLMHIKSVHTELSSHEQAFVHECKRYTPGVLPERGCSLCGIVCNDVEDMECHIGKHLELFALAALMNEEVPDEEIVESNDMIMDYIEELPEPHRDHEGKSVQDAIMGNNDPYQMASVDMEISSHMDDTVDAFDADDIEDISREVPNKSWDDRFVSFLDGQPEPGSIKPLYSNHRSRYDNFVGRDVDLQAIRRCLLPGKIVTLSGRGGIGKTALAVEYFHTYESDFSYIFWVEAEDSGLCAEQYALIADTLKLKQKPLADADTVTYQIRETLVKIQARFLLIFDNVDSWVNVSRYMPRNLPLSQGSVLITTRNGPILEIPDWYPVSDYYLLLCLSS